MTIMQTLFNPTDAPTVYDTAGHQVDAHAHTQGDPADKTTAALITAGVLAVCETVKPDAAKPSKGATREDN